MWYTYSSAIIKAFFLIEIQTFSFKKMHLKMSSGKWRSFCLGLNVLKSILVGSAVYLMVVIRQDMLNTLVPVRIANGFCVSYQQLFGLADQVVDWFTYGPKPCNCRDLRMSTKNGNPLLPTPPVPGVLMTNVNQYVFLYTTFTWTRWCE